MAATQKKKVSAGKLAASGLTAVVGAMAVGLVIGVALLATGGGGCSSGGATGNVGGVPAQFIPIYKAAAARYHLGARGPSILAGIHSIETNFGGLKAPGVSSGENFAGAGGPMQFEASTWATYGVDGNHDGKIDRYNAADAIFAAANYLHASGAPGNWHAAIFSYNHANWYVNDVMGRATKYQAAAGSGAGGASGAATLASVDVTDVSGCSDPGANGPLPLTPGQRAKLLSNGVAAAPTDAPEKVKLIIAAGNSLLGKPYKWGGGHGSFNDSGYDCSGTLSFALHAAGLLSAPLDSTALSHHYAPGPGQYITIYANSYHTFMYVAGIRLDTSSNSDHGPAASKEGPRWRTWPRPTSGFIARHPVGL